MLDWRGLFNFDRFALHYRRLPSQLKYALFQARFGSAIKRKSGLSRWPVLQHQTFDDLWLAEFEKDAGRLVIRFNRDFLFENRVIFDNYWKRLPIMISLFTGTNPHIRRAAVEISDGGYFADGTMSFCSNNPNAALVPDVNFMRRNGYRRYRRLGAAHVGNWNDRKAIVLWRGAASDDGAWDTELDASNAALRPRIRMAIMLRDQDRVDAKIYRIPSAPPSGMERLRQHRLAGEFIPQETWVGYKFAIDIDGVTNAWGNLYNRHLLGCCVLKVASPRGYRQWYYDDLQEWRHYVPVRSDLSDLHEKIAWCFAHDGECRAIAAAAQELALRRTVETETARTIQKLNAQLANGHADGQRLSGAAPSGSST